MASDPRYDETVEIPERPAARTPPPPPPPPPNLLADRYELGRLLGRGGFGSVHEAIDRLTGDFVAVKLVNNIDGTQRTRVRREITALRLLRVPGVVRLLDDGELEGGIFLVMRLVRGTPFPGIVPDGWDSVCEVTLGLLRTLSTVHAAGVIHRDLKPANILVEDGRPVLLDFGLALGEPVGPDMTREGLVVGTPRYLSPEQLLGEPATPQSDLYSVGLMLYQALAGVLPHDADSVGDIARRRVHEGVPPLRDEARDVPRPIAEVIDAMLARSPSRRPRRVDSALRALENGAPASVGLDGVWSPTLVGRDGLVDRIVRDLRDGQVVCLDGPPGAGRSTIAGLVHQTLLRTSQVRELRPSARPFGSLDEALAGEAPPRTHQLSDARAWVLDRLGRQDVVLLGDHPAGWDRWTREIMGAMPGPALFGQPFPELGEHARRHAVGPLTPDQLRGWFDGVDRLFHEVEDAAAELFRRTGGLPGRAVQEARSWVDAGLATAAGSRLHIERRALDRLRGGLRAPSRAGAVEEPAWTPQDRLLSLIDLAWPHSTPPVLAAAAGRPEWEIEAELELMEARGQVRRLPDGAFDAGLIPRAEDTTDAERRRLHGLIGDALPPGEPGRWTHLLAGGGHPSAIVDEAARVADRALEAGHIEAALAVAEETLTVLRGSCGADTLTPVLLRLVDASFGAWTERALELAHYHLSRLDGADVGVPRHLQDLVRLGLQAYRVGGPEVAAELARLAPFADARIELRRQGARVIAARSASIDAEAAVLDELQGWCQGRDEPAAALVSSWRGGWLYRAGRYEEAAEQHLAAAGRVDPSATVAARLNAAAALVEARQLDRAQGVAEEAREAAARLRHGLLEARAEWILRTCLYRRGAAGAPDLELVDLVDRLGLANLSGMVALTEAAIAWRSGDAGCAERLAARSVEAWEQTGRRWPRGLARALELATSKRVWMFDILNEARVAAECPSAEIAAQTLALLGSRAPEIQERATALVRSARLMEDDAILDVLSIAECAQGLPVK